MRFSAVIQQVARLAQTPAKPADAARVERLPPAAKAPLQRPDEPPADLDQRVRLVGEW
jgi:hypothetical protein